MMGAISAVSKAAITLAHGAAIPVPLQKNLPNLDRLAEGLVIEGPAITARQFRQISFRTTARCHEIQLLA